MTPIVIGGIISGIEQLVGVIIEARRNGSLSDADLDAATSKANESTRAMIAAEIAKQS
jgi:hypothetical protein